MKEARTIMMEALKKCIATSDHADELAGAMEEYFESSNWQKRMQWSPLLDEMISAMEEASDSRIDWH